MNISMGELEFEQLWEYRGRDNDFDSSSDDSKSNTEPFGTKHKLEASLIPVGDDETSETSRAKQRDNENLGTKDQVNVGKAKRPRTRNINKRKRDSPEEVDLTKGETTTHDPTAPLDEVKSFMELLLEELRVTRENLVKQMMEEMQKLVGDDTNPEPKRRKRRTRGEKVQLQQPKNSRKVQRQHEKVPKESMQFQHPNNHLEENIQVQHHNNFQETVLPQQQNNYEDNIELQQLLQEEANINMQHQNYDFKYGMSMQNCNNRPLVTFPASGNAAVIDGVGSGQVTDQLIASSKKNKRDSLSISANPNLQTSCGSQNVQAQGQKTVVLAIEAQKGKGGYLKRRVKGKKIIEDQGGQSQARRTAVASEHTNGEKLGLSVVDNFLSSPSGQTPSSMYSNFLTDPIVATQGLDASLCNYILPRVADKKRGVNLERMNRMLEPSYKQGSFPAIQPEERIGSFAPTESRHFGTSGIGTGFSVPLHQGIDVGLSIPRRANPEYLSPENNKFLPLRMHEEAFRFPGGSYNLSGHPAANNNHIHSAYKSDGRHMSYQIQNFNHGHLFPQ